MRLSVPYCIALAAWLALGWSVSKAAQIEKAGSPKTVERAISQYRKTEVRIIVLNAAGEAASGASVHLRQLRHGFELGFVLPAEGWPAGLKNIDASARTNPPQVLRCFSAVSLERQTRWSSLETESDPRPNAKAIERLLTQAHRRGMTVGWGGLISADEAYNPDWLTPLSGGQLQEAVSRHVVQTLSRYGNRAGQFDIYTHILNHHFVEQRLGMAMVRRLFQRARAKAPQASLGLGIGSALDRRAGVKAVQRITEFKQAQVPFDRVAVDQTFDGQVREKTLRLALERLTTLDLPVVIRSLEVSAPNRMQAALNLKTVLRCLFAEPRVRGIYFQGLQAKDLTYPHAALLDSSGQPTPAGRTLDRLFYDRWRTDRTVTANRAGEIKTRVFAGTYEVQAQLPNGQQAHTRIQLPMSDQTPIVILQPLAH